MQPDVNPSLARIAGAIRARRIDLGMSQEDLVAAVGVSRARLSSLENGGVHSMRILLEVCDALGLELFAFAREDASRVTAAVKDVLPPQRPTRRRVLRGQEP